jgi:DNA-binding LacI/PurR family transcriptional regulator
MGSINITRVAQEAGVSKATISNYLKKKQGKISEKTCLRIENVIQRLHYIPNFGARRIIINNNRPQTIGIILEDASINSMFTNIFYGMIHSGISDAFKTCQYRLMIIPSMFTNAAENVEYFKELSRGFVDGYMLFNIHEQDQYVEVFRKYNIPFICIGNMKAKNIRNYVGTDYVGGIRNAAEHLFSHNIFNIAVSTGYINTIVGWQMREGYYEAFKKRGLSFPEQNIISGKETDSESIYDECMELLQGDDPPQAFIVSENHYHDLIKASADLKLKLFEDVKVIVVNYYPQILDPRITHLKVPRYLIGKMAAEKMVDLLEGRPVVPFLFSMEFIQGTSCGCGSNTDKTARELF